MAWTLASADEMRALDRHTIETLGVPGELLMESAGRAVADAVLGLLAPGASVLVVCGRGNNGGDGLVAARHLHALGVPVRAALLGSAASLRGDAAANLRRARAAGVPIEGERWRAPAAGVIVDAIFGTGLSRPVEGAAASSIRRIAASRAAHPELRVVAVDLPSGLCADTGQVLGAAAPADLTVTLALPKPGLALEPGRSLRGPGARRAHRDRDERARRDARDRALDARAARARGCPRGPRPDTREASATRCWSRAPRARPARRRSPRTAPRAAARAW